MGSFMMLWVTVVGASAILGGISFALLLFTKIPRKPPLSSGAILAWVGTLLTAGIFVASFSTGEATYQFGPESRMTVFFSGLGQTSIALLIGFMAAGLTGFLPETKRPNFIRATLLLSTIVLAFSGIGQVLRS